MPTFPIWREEEVMRPHRPSLPSSAVQGQEQEQPHTHTLALGHSAACPVSSRTPVLSPSSLNEHG